MTRLPSVQRIFLIGFMGAGKSTVGPRLAAALGWAFADSDAWVAEAAGRPLADVFAREGEAGFRRREGLALAALSARPRCVVAVGGGAPSVEDNWRHLARGLSVYLTLDPAALDARLAGQARPLLAGLRGARRAARIARLLAQREPCYRRADVCVRADGPPEAVVARILERIEPCTLSK